MSLFRAHLPWRLAAGNQESMGNSQAKTDWSSSILHLGEGELEARAMPDATVWAAYGSSWLSQGLGCLARAARPSLQPLWHCVGDITMGWLCGDRRAVQCRHSPARRLCLARVQCPRSCSSCTDRGHRAAPMEGAPGRGTGGRTKPGCWVLGELLWVPLPVLIGTIPACFKVPAWINLALVSRHGAGKGTLQRA